MLGLSVSIASTVVLIKNLTDAGLYQSHGGRVATGWLIVEDLATVVILVVLPVSSARARPRVPSWRRALPKRCLKRWRSCCLCSWWARACCRGCSVRSRASAQRALPVGRGGDRARHGHGGFAAVRSLGSARGLPGRRGGERVQALASRGCRGHSLQRPLLHHLLRFGGHDGQPGDPRFAYGRAYCARGAHHGGQMAHQHGARRSALGWIAWHAHGGGGARADWRVLVHHRTDRYGAGDSHRRAVHAHFGWRRGVDRAQFVHVQAYRPHRGVDAQACAARCPVRAPCAPV